MFELARAIPYQSIAFDRDITVTVKRVDLVHPHISGNKFYKLKYNLLAARAQGKNHLISFGGAYSNHIHALAHAAHEYGFSASAYIRGQELAAQPLNPTLQDAADLGMRLHFISRADYRQKHTPEFLQAALKQYLDAYILPEGGSNALAIQGCEEILSAADTQDFEVIVCAVGTGGTIAGLINASAATQRIIGYAALNSDYLSAEVALHTRKRNWHIKPETVFGGYGHFNSELLAFIDATQAKHQLPLDPVYTGKAFYRLCTQIAHGDFAPNSRILFIHTGGLQGHRVATPPTSATMP